MIEYNSFRSRIKLIITLLLVHFYINDSPLENAKTTSCYLEFHKIVIRATVIILNLSFFVRNSRNEIRLAPRLQLLCT